MKVARSAALIACAAAALLSIATLVLVGQPIYANDTWSHLALGRVFLDRGPLLDTDPFLFAAPGPPEPSSWLGSVALHATWSLFGFTGLRLLHVLLVATTLLLAWRLFRAVSASSGRAALLLVLFVAASTYRLVQLRPELFTVVATLATVALLLFPVQRPGALRIAAAAALAVVWVNVHAGFLLGPILVGGVGAFLLGASWLPWTRERPACRARGIRLCGVALVLLAATLVNPRGYRAHLVYLEAGADTPGLASVVDEWRPVDLLAWPLDGLPPTPAAWLVAWSCVVVLAVAVGLLLLRLRRAPAAGLWGDRELGLIALAVAGIVASVTASRFLWLLFLPLLLLGFLLDARRAPSRPSRGETIEALAVALATLAACALHVRAGDWPVVSRSLEPTLAAWARPFNANKMHAHSVWFLDDTGVSGRLYNDYHLGGFLSFWLTPELQLASSGTMNVRREAMETMLAIGAGRSNRPGESLGDALDRHGIDLFLAVGLPVPPRPARPIASTIRLLQDDPAWLLVFRSLRDAVYLRKDGADRENLARIVAWYEGQGVPFDPARGFDVARVIDEASQWAVEHGLVAEDFHAVRDEIEGALDAGRVDPRTHWLSLTYMVLGLYEQAGEVDRRLLERQPGEPRALSRLLRVAIQQGRFAEALEHARQLEAQGWVETGGWAEAVAGLRALPPAERRRYRNLLPLLDFEDARRVVIRLRAPEPRSRPRRGPAVETGAAWDDPPRGNAPSFLVTAR